MNMSIARGIATSIVGPIAGGREGDPTLTLHHEYTRSGYAVVGPELTFTRASTATYFDSDGVMQTAAIDAMRINSHVYEGGAWVNKGLLIEGQATNLLTYSEDFSNADWTKGQVAFTANAIVPDGTNNVHLLSRNVTVSSSTAYVIWGIFKARELSKIGIRESNTSGYCSFNLTTGAVITRSGATGDVISLGNDQYLCWVGITTGGAQTSFGVRIYALPNSYTSGSVDGTWTGNNSDGVEIYRSQLETGSFATSYIPTAGSAVTRSADVATIGGTDFSGFYNASEGTVVVDATPPQGSQSFAKTVKIGSTDSFSMDIGRNATSQRVFIIDGVNLFTDSLSPTWENGFSAKSALAYKENDCAVSFNGDAIRSDNSVTIPAATSLFIGRDISGGTNGYWNGYIASLKYFNVRKPNAYLESVTA